MLTVHSIHTERRAPSSAVAHLVLAKSMRAFVILVFLLWPLGTYAETRGMENLTKEGFVGTWEAIIQDESMATGVYQMLVPAKGDAKLIQLSAGLRSKFFGRAASWELANGKIKIRFMMDPEHVPYYDWIEIQGSAVGEEGAGAIVGKIMMHRTDTVLHDWSEPVFFKKGRWAQDLDAASREAEKTLRAARMKDGHAVPETP